MNNFVQGFDPEIFSIDAKIKNRSIRRSQILKAIGCPHLKIDDYDGYFLWVYDTYPNENYDSFNSGFIYETISTYCHRLNDMSLDEWVRIGKDFVKEVETAY